MNAIAIISAFDNRGLGKLTNNGQERDIFESSVQGEETENSQSNDTPDNGTSCVVRENIHGDGESQKMRCHAEYAVNDVSSTENFSSPGSHQDSTNVYISCDLRNRLETGNIERPLLEPNIPEDISF